MNNTQDISDTVLMIPNRDRLPDYVDALKRGWSPDNLRAEVAIEQIEEIARDAEGFLARQEDRAALGRPVTLSDGSKAARLPSFRRWIWRDGFAGSIGLRWAPGTEALPPHCLGHIGYAVVPWRRREGLATAAVTALLPEAKAIGLRHVEISTDPDNTASIGVAKRAGAVLQGRGRHIDALGAGEALLFRITLTS